MIYKLSDIFDLQMGKTPDRHNDDYWKIGTEKWISISDLSKCEKYIINTKEKISKSAICESGIKSIPANTVIMSFKLSIGKVAITKEPIYSNEAIMAFIDKGLIQIDSSYLYYLLRFKDWEDGTNKAVMGKTLNKATLSNIKVDICSYDEQLKIVEKLDKLSAVIISRQQQLEQLDTLIKARFVEMFGDSKNTVRLGDCCEVHARIGWQALTKNEHRKSGEYMLITGTDFKDGKINYDTCVYVDKDRYEMDQHIILKENDVLITKDGTIGKVAVVHNLPKPATLNAGIFVVRPNEQFDKDYISYVFRGPLFEDFVEQSKTGATIKHLNQKHLVEFKIPLPSIEEQKSFANFSKQVDKSKVVVQNICLFSCILSKILFNVLFLT